jgi:hypothetical protein
MEEAASKKDDWGVLQSGLFRGSYDRFATIATDYEKRLKTLNWY